jgi:hypothetical protein
MSKPIKNLDKLISEAHALQLEPALQAVLKPYPIPQEWSAYSVLIRYRKQHQLYQDAKDPGTKKFWREAIEILEPVVKAIAQHLEDSTHA